MTDSVTQDLDRYMDEEEQQELEHDKELEQAEDKVVDIHSTIMSLKKFSYEIETYANYEVESSILTISIEMSEVEGEAFLESLSRKSTDKYIVEKTAIEEG
tara:strand:+ start:2384 stop:2686 length:303 start_codon:yes stop_codon:yes gene_type:complete